MTTFAVAIGAGGEAILPGGDNIVILSAPNPLSVELTRGGQRVETANNVPVSWYWRAPEAEYRREQPAFDRAIIRSATAQTIAVEISRGNSGVNTVVGTVSVQSPVAASQAETTMSQSQATNIAANANRMALTIYNHPTSAGFIYVRPASGSGDGLAVPPGGFISFQSTVQFRVSSEASAGSYTWGYIEEASA